ncbi:MAG: MFS transporter [Ruminococcaceae bacterium]|nr:MFS transporter [Oscillospiraceae bacterium]
MSTINVEHDINIHLENKGISRRFFLYIFAMYSLVCMTKNCFNGALADIVSEGVLTKSQTGLITAMFYIVYTPLQIVGGIFADKFSPERMIKIGLIGGAIANTVIFFNHNYYVMLASWILNGVVQFALWPSTYKIVSSQLCRSDRTYMIFVITLASYVGLVISYIVAGILPSWEYNFAFSAAVLFLLSVGLHIYDKHLNPYMKPDYKPVETKSGTESVRSLSTVSLFMKSGFFGMLIAVLGYTIVAQGSKTLFPIMVVETFGKSASVGNLLNTLIIVAGIAGVFFLRFVLYPRFVKNEVFGMLIFMALTAGFGLILIWAMEFSVVVITFSSVSFITSMVGILVSYCNVEFVKYGKNGTAAGISNAASALGYAISSYVIVKISEVYDWQVVKFVWLALSLVSVVSLALILPMWIRFKKKGLD